VYYIEDPDHPASEEVLSLANREQQFMAEYFNRTGIQWRHYFGPDGPRPPPTHFMWPAKAVGDVHRIYSSQGYWHCSEAREKCQSTESVKLELEVLSLKPRVFVIENFISEHEADHIINLAQPRLHHSSVGDIEAGAFESDTRTSLNSWIPRDTTEIMDSLYRRAADLLQIDEKLLVRSGAVEDLQVVHYVDGQKYEAHHDWVSICLGS